MMKLHETLVKYVFSQILNQIKVDEHIILDCFVRYESFYDFAHKVLLRERG